MKSVVKSIFLFVIILFVAFGCAANKNASVAESESGKSGDQMEEYFGTSGDVESSEPSSDEEEVLRLLGINPSEKSESEPGMAEAAAVEDINSSVPGENADTFSEMEREIATLKAELEMKNRKISELESGSEEKKVISSTFVAGDYKEDYQYALAEYNNRKYKNAISIFESLLSRDGNNSLSDNCQYWIGEAYYGLNKYNQAIVEFTKVFSFNKSNKADAAQLKLGICYWKLGETAKANDEFERLITEYPKSEFVSKARKYLAD